MALNNVGSIDRILRIILGAVLIALAVTDTIGWWGWIGVIFILSGVTSTCFIYKMLGINTAKK